MEAMATTKQFRSRQVEEWLDGATIQTEDDGNGPTVSFVWNLYDQVLKFFTVLVPLISEDHLSAQSTKHKKSLKDSLGRLFLWGDGFRYGALETTLETSDDLNETVLETLVEMGKTLIFCLFPACDSFEHPSGRDQLLDQLDELETLLEKATSVFEIDQESNESDEGDKGDLESDQSISDKISKAATSLRISAACLMDLLPSMENVLNYAYRELRNAGSSEPIGFKVSGPAQPYVLNVLDRFSKADARLVERLGEANWQRHMTLRNIKGPTTQDVSLAKGVVSEIQTASKSTFAPVSLFHDSGLGSLPAQSSYSATVASHSSLVSSLAEKENGCLRVPSTPNEVFEKAPFTCQICGHVLSRIQNRIDWKRHVFADLKPYICTYPDCDDELFMFPTRKIWETHEFTKHRIDRTWTCSKCPVKFQLVNEWRTHLNRLHGIEFTDTQFQQAANVTEKDSPRLMHSQQCPLCLCTLGNSRRKFVTHVGKHMESIALTALSSWLDSGSEESCVASDASAAQQDFVEPQKDVLESGERSPATDSDWRSDPYNTPRNRDLSTLACKTCKTTFNDPAALERHIYTDHTRAFTCVFNFAGCPSTFASMNDWKRHVATQHLNFDAWVCNLDACGKAHAESSSSPKKEIEGTSSKGVIFNRKDLFTQHLRRMHAPNRKRPDKQKSTWDDRIKELQKDCLQVNRQQPKALKCPVADCPALFGGSKCWDDRMEHVAEHLEKVAETRGATSVQHENDELLVKWAQNEGIIDRVDGVYRLIPINTWLEGLDQDAEDEDDD